MVVSSDAGSPPVDGRSRLRGAVAGLIPTLAIVAIFAFGGTTATPTEVAVSLALVAFISMTAGWIAGPLAAGQPRRLLVASIGYALAYIDLSAVLSMVLAASDTWIANGPDPLASTTAVGERALVALAGAAYLIVPAVAFGLAWSMTARGLVGLDRA